MKFNDLKIGECFKIPDEPYIAQKMGENTFELVYSKNSSSSRYTFTGDEDWAKDIKRSRICYKHAAKAAKAAKATKSVEPPTYVEVNADGFEIGLTPTQVKKLKPGKKLGCGSSGCAYEYNHEKVVKLTFDESALETIQKMAGHKRIPKTYAAFKLTQTVNGEPVYAVINERLTHLPQNDVRRQWLKNVEGRIGHFGTALSKHALQVWHNSHDLKSLENYRTPSYIRNEIKAEMCSEEYSCTVFADEVFDLFDDGVRHGFMFEDLRTPNIGLDSNGTWKLLDTDSTPIAYNYPRASFSVLSDIFGIKKLK